MAERKPAKKGTQKAAKGATVTGKKLEGFTDEERAAMRGFVWMVGKPSLIR